MRLIIRSFKKLSLQIIANCILTVLYLKYTYYIYIYANMHGVPMMTVLNIN